MANERIEQVASQLSIADISSAIAFGLQRALEARGDIINDKILIYGGRLNFDIQVFPQGTFGVVREATNIGPS